MPRDAIFRPMRADDIEEAEDISARAFLEEDLRTYPRDWPRATRRSPEQASNWCMRTRHYLTTDPSGCWVAEVDGRVVGFATSLRRDLLWILATYAVLPGLQGQGIGKQLLHAAMTHARGCLRGMLAASDDPRALRRYKLAGFDLHPQFVLHGTVDRSRIPELRHVRAGTPADFPLLESLDRRTREASHAPDHETIASYHRLAVIDRPAGQGYAWVDESGRPAILAATNRRTATMLMWEALASSSPGSPVSVPHVTAANQWAVDVAVEAGLAVGTSGHLALRGMRPPAPYLHHGAFL